MLRRVLFICVGVVLGLTTVDVPAAIAAACHKELKCSQGRCHLVVVCDPGGGGGGHGPGHGGVNGAARCYYTGPPRREVPCHDPNFGWWNPVTECWYKLANPQPPKSNSLWQGHTDGAIYDFNCPPVPASTMNGTVWLATPPPGFGGSGVSPAVLAARALASLRLPHPTPGRYPAGVLRDGRPYTVVTAYTWYWTDPASFHTLTARASAGGVWAQVSVTPTALTFSPGDGGGAVSCAGPGVVWRRGDGPWAASPAGCNYRYPHSSIGRAGGEVTATYGIAWTVTWTSSTGETGSLPAMTTTTPARFAVAEVESVVIR